MSVKAIREGASRSTLNMLFLFIVLLLLCTDIAISILHMYDRMLYALLYRYLAGAVELLMLLPFLLYLRKRKFRILSFAGFVNPGKGNILLSIAAGVVGFITNIALINVSVPLSQLAGIESLRVEQMPSISDQNMLLLIIGLVLYLPFIASVPAVIEEFVSRGVLFRTLGRTWPAVFVTCILFALMHVDAVTLPSKLMMGFALGAAVLLSGSLWTSSIMHFINNFISTFCILFIPMVSIRDASWQQEVIVWAGIALVSGAALAALLFAMKKVSRRRDAAMLLRQSAQPVEKLGFENIYIEPPLVVSYGKRGVMNLPLWIAGAVLAAATVLVAVSGYLHWFNGFK